MVGGLALAIERCPQLPLRVDDLEIQDVVSQVSAERLGEAVLPTARRVHMGGIDVPLEASRSVADCAGPQGLRARRPLRPCARCPPPGETATEDDGPLPAERVVEERDRASCRSSSVG